MTTRGHGVSPMLEAMISVAKLLDRILQSKAPDKEKLSKIDVLVKEILKKDGGENDKH